MVTGIVWFCPTAIVLAKMGDGAKWRGEGRRRRRERWSARHRQEPGVPEPDEPEPELPPEPPAEPPVPAEKVDISTIRRDLEEMRRTAQEGREKLLALEMPQGGHMSGSQTWLPKMQQKKCPRKHRQIGGSCSSDAPAIEVKAASSGLAMHHFPLLSIFQSQAATEEELTAVYDELAEHWGQCAHAPGESHETEGSSKSIWQVGLYIHGSTIFSNKEPKDLESWLRSLPHIQPP